MNVIHNATLCALACAAVASAQTRPTATMDRGWSTDRGDFEVIVDPAQSTLVVKGTLRLVLSGAATSHGPTLGLNSRGQQMVFEQGACDGAKVQLGLAHPTRRNVTLAQVKFAAPKRRGDRIDVRFRVVMKKPGKQLAVAKKLALASWVEVWYPIPLAPTGVSLGRATRMKGTTRFVLPKGWSAVTNGHLVSREDQADQTVEVWRNDRALARSFAAGPYRRAVHEVEGLTARLYLLSDAARDPKAHLRALAQAIAAMQKRLGPYPFKTFSIAEVPTAVGNFGASSEQGFILVKPYFLRVKGGNLPLFAHEAAHAWWGNTVGSGGSAALMCSEALAQYGAVIAIEAMEGTSAATEFLRFSRAGYVMNQCARGYFDLIRREWDVSLNKISNGYRQGHRLSDSKGHWVYHMLRRRVGDDVFFATLRQLIAKFDGKTMRLRDVRAAFVAAAPRARLEAFFAQWLDRTGAPEVVAKLVEKDGRQHLELRQRQPGLPYDLDVEVALHPAQGEPIRKTVRLTQARQTFPLEHAERLRRVVVDPDHRLLIWHPKYGVAPSTIPTDQDLTEKELASYVGTYAATVLGEATTIEVFARGARLVMRKKGDQDDVVRKIGAHKFQAGGGVVQFEMKNGRAAAFEFVNAKLKVRATRKGD